MLLKVAIDPELGVELANGRSPYPGGLLLRYLRERCLIALGPGAGAAELLEAFAKCGSPDLANLVSLLLRDRVADAMGGTSTVSISELENADHVSSWTDLAELLLLTQWRSDYLKQDAQTLSPDVSSMRDALHSAAFERLDAAWSRWVARGEKREDIWRQVFEPFARRTQTVFVVDRYLAKTFSSRILAGAHQIKGSGAGWFLGHLSNSRVRTIHVVSSARELPLGKDEMETRRVIQSWFDSLPTSAALDLHIVPGDFKHRRSLAFDGYAGFALDNGLETFNGPTIAEEFELIARAATAPTVEEAFKELTRRSN